jgi:serine/threonine protein phosphatase 1
MPTWPVITVKPVFVTVSVIAPLRTARTTARGGGLESIGCTRPDRATLTSVGKSESAASMFAIGDIHGCAEELDELLGMLPLTPGSTIVFLGDYIDRGPDSRAVIERVIELRKSYEVIALMGNHESMLLDFLDGQDEQRVARFIFNGGGATLASYAEGHGAYRIPKEHLAFFDELRLSYDTSSHFFVHAGVPNEPLSGIQLEASWQEMLWTRKKFLTSEFAWEKVIVHGHTPVRNVEISHNRINLDTGCIYGGALSAMELPSHRTYSVERSNGAGRTLLHDASQRATVRFRGAIPVQVASGGIRLSFQTVDYSEIGLGLRLLDRAQRGILKLDARVTGVIGAGSVLQIPFEGRVVRVAERDGDELFGLVLDLGDPPPEP